MIWVRVLDNHARKRAVLVLMKKGRVLTLRNDSGKNAKRASGSARCRCRHLTETPLLHHHVIHSFVCDKQSTTITKTQLKDAGNVFHQLVIAGRQPVTTLHELITTSIRAKSHTAQTSSRCFHYYRNSSRRATHIPTQSRNGLDVTYEATVHEQNIQYHKRRPHLSVDRKPRERSRHGFHIHFRP